MVNGSRNNSPSIVSVEVLVPIVVVIGRKSALLVVSEGRLVTIAGVNGRINAHRWCQCREQCPVISVQGRLVSIIGAHNWSQWEE